jgi:FixJ family two-component response regulator
MSGRELAGHLVAARTDLAVLFVSGYTKGALGDPLPGLATGFLQKPYTASALGSKIREVLDAAPERV